MNSPRFGFHASSFSVLDLQRVDFQLLFNPFSASALLGATRLQALICLERLELRLFRARESESLGVARPPDGTPPRAEPQVGATRGARPLGANNNRSSSSSGRLLVLYVGSRLASRERAAAHRAPVSGDTDLHDSQRANEWPATRRALFGQLARVGRPFVASSQKGESAPNIRSKFILLFPMRAN